MRKMPFAAFEHNQAWLEVSLPAQTLLRWAARLCLEGELSLAEPKRMRQRLLHVAGRIVRSGRRGTLRASQLAVGGGAGGGLHPAAGAAGRLEPVAPGSALQPQSFQPQRPNSACPRTVPALRIGSRPRKDTRGRTRGTTLTLLPTSSQSITPCEVKTVDQG